MMFEASFAPSAERYLARGSRRGDLRGAPGARAPGPTKGKLCITYEGDVVPCIFNRSQVLGRIGEGRSLLDVLAEPQVSASGRSMDEVLKRCSAKLQCGDCRSTATALELLGAAHGAAHGK